MGKSEVLYEAKNIVKRFGGITALDDASFELKEAEVHALLGENGAGKSTMMKILAGVMSADEGTLFLQGQKVAFKNVKDAELHGISIIHQELNLCEDLTVAENIFLSREYTHHGMVNKKKVYEEAAKILKMLNSSIAPHVKVRTLSVSQKQIIEIAKAISLHTKIIIMDEPTSSLGEQEVEVLFDIINNLREKGRSVIYISHKLEEIQVIADRVTVYRDGRYIVSDEVSNLSIQAIVNAMVGRKLTDFFPRIETNRGSCLLEVNDIGLEGVIHGASFHLFEGEILGVSGLVGAGRTELMKTIVGEFHKSKGKISLKGEYVHIRSVKKSMEHGMVYLSEDRKGEGVFLERSVKFNATLSSLYNMIFSVFKIINRDIQKKYAKEMVDKLRIKTSSNLTQKCVNLSGGNQQKVALSKLLLTKPTILILDEPTRGIDINAKVEIYNILNQLKREGVGIILVSSELPEIVGMSDRVLVMRNGSIVADLERKDITQEKVMHYAMVG